MREFASGVLIQTFGTKTTKLKFVFPVRVVLVDAHFMVTIFIVVTISPQHGFWNKFHSLSFNEQTTILFALEIVDALDGPIIFPGKFRDLNTTPNNARSKRSIPDIS
eukprot:Lithocolla_globosa_v1_NODE_8428_length_822_cov_5.964798.p2 type:complete len:107 gc:universal NODE_8428_length_822_cov_5.964798:662-342(-)